MYDRVGFVKVLFRPSCRSKSINEFLFGKDSVKGAFFAFISTLDTGLPTREIPCALFPKNGTKRVLTIPPLSKMETLFP
jgi:hypothetical protein